MAALLANAGVHATDAMDEEQLEVRLSVYFDLSGEEEAHVMKLGKGPRKFTFTIEENERLSLQLTPLGDCRVSVEIESRESVTTTRPLIWPAFFVPGDTFAVGVHAARHRQEVRGAVVGIGACSSVASNATERESRH